MYFLLIDYGCHKLWVETSKQYFFDWIDSLKSEFDVYSDTNSDGCEHFYIIDYLGNPYYFGCRKELE